MSKHHTIQKLEKKQLKADLEMFHVGDTVRVHTRIIEGEKERTQIFSGTVIARKGSGLSETFSVHRVAYGEGMVKVFPLHSPRISKIEVVKEGKVRRSKLYYLKGTTGKAAKVKGRVVARKATPAATLNHTENSVAKEQAETAENQIHSEV
ncbi:50S ribosomal protein L19 [Chlamydiales bacterium STE3]|nr:50S ribosomal protein L19 [Chlamydiales bacterium STE3]